MEIEPNNEKELNNLSNSNIRFLTFPETIFS